jgi:hypothetical protein
MLVREQPRDAAGAEKHLDTEGSEERRTQSPCFVVVR